MVKYFVELDYVQHLLKEVLNDQAITILNDVICHITALTANNKSVNQTCEKTNFQLKTKINFYQKKNI